jgi:hypothetical protein
MKIIRYLLDGLGHDKIVFLEMLPYASQYINTACEKNNYVEIETDRKNMRTMLLRKSNTCVGS